MNLSIALSAVIKLRLAERNIILHLLFRKFICCVNLSIASLTYSALFGLIHQWLCEYESILRHTA